MTTKTITYTFATCLAASAAIMPMTVSADVEKDCLLQGKVMHDERGEQAATRVDIHSVSRYSDDTRCSVRRGQKMEFKLPSDERLQQVPSGSEVEYRYRSDEEGNQQVELISIGA